LSTFALIPAAGSGTRAPGERPKQYAALAGRPMLWHAVRAVCVPPVERVFAVLAPDDAHFAAQDWSAFGERLEPLAEGAPVLRGEMRVVRRQHREHPLHRRHANCSNRMPEHRTAGERGVLLRALAGGARAATRGRDQRKRRQKGRVSRKSF